MKKIILLLLTIISTNAVVKAQYSTNRMYSRSIDEKDYTLIGGNIGGSVYSGSYASIFNDNRSAGDIQATYSAYLQKKVSKKVHFRLQGSYIGLGATTTSEENGTYQAFDTWIIEVTPMAIIDLGRRGTLYKKRLQWYLMLGTGVMIYEVENHENKMKERRPGGCLFAGIGARYKLNERFMVTFEAQGRISSSYNIDQKPNTKFPTDCYADFSFGLAYRIFGTRYMR